ncbi:uncharacterized protein LOC125542992 [Triticum urartu]|uniref:uncharacterized protein LOC125542990 n=1 Tax=Triticum urartu TaxID=4572 RepID=UPI0020436703|nr:uncharacterized protein LOC125542990 [Triticum urartu]XP_048562194.1 uncharacterized protein LOC125542992 [Triticum urartu]
MEAARHAGKKRGPEDDAEAEVHHTFRGAANALSQLYAQAVANQKASFIAGERHAMERTHRWISSQHEEASGVSVADVLAYLQNEIESRGGMAGSSQHPTPQPAYGLPSANVQINSFSFGNVAAALDSQLYQTDQTRTAGISNVFSSPSQQNSHSNHLVQCSGHGPVNSPPSGSRARNDHSPQNQDSVHPNSYEPSMDMNHDAP